MIRTKLSTLYSLLFILFVLNGVISAQTIGKTDTAEVRQSNVDSTKETEEFNNGYDFKELKAKQSNWLLDLLESIFGNRSTTNKIEKGYDIIKWLIFASGLLVAIFFIYKKGLFKLLFNQKNNSLTNDNTILKVKDINSINVDQLITKYFSEGNYRMAIRYRFLKLLKILNDNDKIKWKNYKTNYDYYNELSNNKQDFMSCIKSFEACVYGDFEATLDVYNNTELAFVIFEKNISAAITIDSNSLTNIDKSILNNINHE